MCFYFIPQQLSKIVRVKQNNFPIFIKFYNYILSRFLSKVIWKSN